MQLGADKFDRICVTVKILPYIKSMAQCRTAVTPLLTHWSYCSLALNHRYISCLLVKSIEVPNDWCGHISKEMAVLGGQVIPGRCRLMIDHCLSSVSVDACKITCKYIYVMWIVREYLFALYVLRSTLWIRVAMETAIRTQLQYQ